ncbi:hypothetical protein [Natronincola ferrireducens]|uniref:Global transcriptional regulator CodY n=1 Tax=Natronincola ferrireducens TaxID=393762 RepID=A0A1G9GXI0_9FIRM|nr:hypothetical protein [Natronincola ferrireducens]SDL05379.1 transcriptional pleiotropic repressor [Natronincola ferrireducens]
MSEVINKLKCLNSVLKKSSTNFIPLDELCMQLGDILSSNIYLFNNDGNIFSYYAPLSSQCIHNKDSLVNYTMPDIYMDIFRNTDNVIHNSFENKPKCTCPGVTKCIYKNRYFSLVPIFCNFIKISGILLIRYEKAFDVNEEFLYDYASVIISLELMRQQQKQIEAEAIEKTYTNLALKSLSFSELTAAAAIIENMHEDEATIILNKVSASAYVTRSIISSTIKKLESAGTIETKCLGVKGTYIKILNKYIRSAIIEKIKDNDYSL